MKKFNIVINNKKIGLAKIDKCEYMFTKCNPYVSPGLSRETKFGKVYTGFEADVAKFNDLYMRDFHYSPNSVNKMGLGIDEVLDSSINFSRKNYACYFPENPYPTDVKLVGNTIKSKKMPEYIAKFLDRGVRLLLQKKGQEFLDEYYSYISKIYNWQIPLKHIASKGKVKKSINEYIADCETITKAGRPKSRQAWMELAIRENLDVCLGETIYYINTGSKKNESDVKKVTHYYELIDGEKKESKVKLEKEWKISEFGKNAKNSLKDFIRKYHPEISIEEEIILNCKLIPASVIESDTNELCDDGDEYNVPKYIEQFNNRIKPLLVCFNPDIRSKILITNPSDRPYFTEAECTLDSSHPNKPTDQDTYEQLMTMDDKEIRFWMKHPEWNIPFLKECGMDWDKIVSDYLEREERARQVGADVVKEEFNNILKALSYSEIKTFVEEGEIPDRISNIVNVDPVNGNFVHKQYEDIVIGSVDDFYCAMNEKLFESECSEE